MKFLQNIFWNGEQHRLRAAWRIILQLLLFLIVLIGLALITNAFGSGFGMATLGSLLYLAGGLGMIWLLARFIDHRPFADYGFHFDRAWWLDLGFGLFLGAFLMTGVFLTEKMAGWVAPTVTLTTSDPLPFALAFLVKLLVYLAVGVNEELAFRGYLLKNLAEGLAGKRLGPRAAIALAFVISAALFGLGHITNENASAISTLNLVIDSFLISLPFLLTGELAASIGLHIAWNLFEGTVFGLPVSGSLPTTHLFTTLQSGPELWTGGAFGPEAGLVFLAWLPIGCCLVLAWVKFLRKQLELHLPLAAYKTG